jgi:hypothetical protein
MSNSHALLKFVRSVHLYLGVFLSPALLFFAFTGALQTFSLHETTAGSSYQPPAWAVTLAQLHKKQTTVVPVRKAKPQDVAKAPDGVGPAAAGKADGQMGSTGGSKPATDQAGDRAGSAKDAGRPAGQAQAKSHLPMKIFFLLVAVGLFTSTLTGIYMAYRYKRNGWLISGLLVAGVVAPLVLLPF